MRDIIVRFETAIHSILDPSHASIPRLLSF